MPSFGILSSRSDDTEVTYIYGTYVTILKYQKLIILAIGGNWGQVHES